MKNLLLLLTTVIFSIGLCSSGCTNEEQSDNLGKFVSEEAIFNEVKKQYDGISKDDVCIDEIKDFKTLFIVGFFAHDRGCGDNQYFYKGHSIELDEKNIQTILVDNGFNTDKIKTVEKYHNLIINHLNSTLDDTPKRFDTLNYEFHPPKVWEEDGQIISSIWVQKPGGMMPEDSFYLSVFIVDDKGMKISHSKKNKFTVPFN